MVDYVYQITNLVNNKKYIGKHHGELDDDYYGSGTLIKDAIKKYGKENFRKDILYIANSEKEAYEKEAEFIELFDAVNNPEYYNIAPGGEYTHSNSLSFTRDRSYCKTEEYRKKMSLATSGEKNGMYGKHHTEESKKKMSKHSKGLTAGEKNGMYGHSGQKALNGRWIAMCDQDGNIIQLFKAKTAALEFLGLKGHTALDKAIKNNTMYRGYYWKNIDKKTYDESVETNRDSTESQEELR